MTDKELKDKLYTAIARRNAGEGSTEEVQKWYARFEKQILKKGKVKREKRNSNKTN